MQVTNNLILALPSSGDVVEASRILPTQGNTLFAVTVQVGSTGPGITLVEAKLQWSNDMDNWQDVSSASGSVPSGPDKIVFDNMSAVSRLPGVFVRLWYTVSGSTPFSRVLILSADIDLKSS